MTSSATKMAAAATVKPSGTFAASDRGAAPRARFDGETLIALELLLAVAVAEATIVFHAALSNAVVGALYITVT